MAGAWAVCFGGSGWPSAVADEMAYCSGLDDEEGPNAVSGPQHGVAKTTLCQALLKCVHATQCPGAGNMQSDCYCGPGVSLSTCTAAGFSPMGMCKDQLAAAIESNQFSTAAAFFGDVCLANGAAFFLYDWCDTNCCSKECLGVQMDGDPDMCNAQGGGAGTSGGAAGTSGGIGGRGGGAAGSPGAAGSLSAGKGGTGGTPAVGAVVANPRFDTNLEYWTVGAMTSASRSTTDASGTPSSGSLDLVVTAPAAQAAQGEAFQCVPIAGGSAYLVSVQGRLGGTGAGAGQAALGLSYFASTDCSGDVAGEFTSLAASPSSWRTLNGLAQVPPSIRSMRVRLLVLKPAGQPSAEALFDDVAISR
jgi:hypothetical protein